jgi:hypothetical protein
VPVADLDRRREPDLIPTLSWQRSAPPIRVESDRVACQATIDPVVGAEDVGMVIEDPAVMGPDLHDLVCAARGDVDEVP